MNQHNQPIALAGGSFGAYRHACAFFASREEEYRVITPFIKDGIERGERGLHVIDPALRDDHLARLSGNGVRVDELLSTGQLEVRDWNDVYLKDGYFDQDRMLGTIKSVLDSADREPYTPTRMYATMKWPMEGHQGAEDIVEYEARVNYLWPQHEGALICSYDLSGFSGIVIDIMRTHPMVIIGGVLQENPFYVPPDDFLQELRARGNQQAVSE